MDATFCILVIEVPCGIQSKVSLEISLGSLCKICPVQFHFLARSFLHEVNFHNSESQILSCHLIRMVIRRHLLTKIYSNVYFVDFQFSSTGLYRRHVRIKNAELCVTRYFSVFVFLDFDFRSFALF